MYYVSGAGQPFVNPDGTPAIYNPPNSQQSLRGVMVGQTQQQSPQQSSQPQQPVQPPQPQLSGSLVTQVRSRMEGSEEMFCSLELGGCPNARKVHAKLLSFGS